MSEPIAFELPDSVLNAIAERAAALVLESLGRDESASASPFLSVDEAAEYLRAKPHRVYDLLSSGRLTRHKDGSRVLVAREELEASLNGVAQRLPTRRRNGMASGVAR